MPPRAALRRRIQAAAVLLPVTLAKIVECVLKSSNPDGVDITQGLAYLRPILITAWVSLALMGVLAVVLNIMVQRRHGSAAVGWIVLGVQVVLGVVYLLGQSGVDGLVGRPQ